MTNGSGVDQRKRSAEEPLSSTEDIEISSHHLKESQGVDPIAKKIKLSDSLHAPEHQVPSGRMEPAAADVTTHIHTPESLQLTTVTVTEPMDISPKRSIGSRSNSPVKEAGLAGGPDNQSNSESLKENQLNNTAATRHITSNENSSQAKDATAVPVGAHHVDQPEKQSPKVLHDDGDFMRFTQDILRALKKHRDAGPFLVPVDPVALGIPQYFDVIKNPMDFSTVEKKLASRDYRDLDAFVSDIRLIFTNSFTFNPADHIVHKMAKNLEKYFNNHLKKFYQIHASGSLVVNTSANGSSGIVSESPLSSRPKREIHAPAKDLPVDDGSKRKKTGRRLTEELRWCSVVYKELMKKQYEVFMFPFYKPVDPIALNIPTYFDIVKRPMDLSRIRQKLDENEYTSCEEFESDVRLMFNNCFLFNPPASDVYVMSQKALELFNRKWNDKPMFGSRQSFGGNLKFDKRRKSDKFPYGSVNMSDDGSSSSDEEDSAKTIQIQMIEQQIMFLQQQLDALRQSKKSKKKSKKNKNRRASSALDLMKPLKSVGGSNASVSSSTAKPKRPKADKDEFIVREISFEEKRELSELINNLDGDKLSTVVQIIRDSLKDLPRSGEEEIELDMDTLDLVTLNKLWNFVKGNAKKRSNKKPLKQSETVTDPAEHEARLQQIEQELARMDGRVDKQKRGTKDEGGSSSETSGSDSGSDSDSE